jgi:dTDP-glucose pyrophosphorylase
MKKGAGIFFVIPMAGLGLRFKDAGYNIPKFMIEVGDFTLFDYSIFSLPLEISQKVIFIILKEHEDNFKVKKFIEDKMSKMSKYFKVDLKIEIIILEKPTRGQAETVLSCRDLIPLNSDIAIYNIDTYFYSRNLSNILKDNKLKMDGVIGGFKIKGKDNKWSFARAENNVVIETAEKIQISDIALTGFYHFSRSQDFFDTAKAAIESGERSSGEFYIAPMYNQLIKNGKRFSLDIAEKIIPMGTPLDVKNIDLSQIKNICVR